MKKSVVSICCGLILSDVAIASVNVKVLGKCTDILNGTISSSIPSILHSELQKLCNSPSTWNCSSLSAMLCGADYEIIAFNVGLVGTSTLQQMVMCLPLSESLCGKMNNGYPTTYGGIMNTPYLDSLSYGNRELYAAEFYNCCYNCPFGNWQDVNGKNYQISYAGTCDASGNCSVLTANAKYRCVAGYYGTSTNCIQCPPSENHSEWVYSDVGATTMAQCYVVSEITYGDDTGLYGYTRHCYY